MGTQCQLKLIQIKFNQINAIKCRFLRRRENRSTQEENLSEQRREATNKLNGKKVGYYLGVLLMKHSHSKYCLSPHLSIWTKGDLFTMADNNNIMATILAANKEHVAIITVNCKILFLVLPILILYIDIILLASLFWKESQWLELLWNYFITYSQTKEMQVGKQSQCDSSRVNKILLKSNWAWNDWCQKQIIEQIPNLTPTKWGRLGMTINNCPCVTFLLLFVMCDFFTFVLRMKAP